ncbi:hypothetical protein EDC04DRAFT_3090682 [Pisolithus marmoratus]|nr:hypothetical protein EDC04DRAFT_3090682 [Pisolithus marmoratus]
MAPTGRTYRSFGTPRPSNGYPAGTEASVDLQVNLSTGNVSPSEANAAESGENMESTGERSIDIDASFIVPHVESTTLISRSAEANRWQIPSGVKVGDTRHNLSKEAWKVERYARETR